MTRRFAAPLVVLGLGFGLGLGLGGLAGCKTENPAFCANPANAGIEGCPDAGGGAACDKDSDCKMPDRLACDLTVNQGTCVQCTQAKPDACSGTRPVCVSDACQACTMHSQCASRACLADGSCADATQVAYVRPNGGGSACTDAAPCKKVSDGVKAKAIVKVEGTIMDDATVVIDGKAVQIVADPGAKLVRMGMGVVVDVKNNGADAQISDLEITGGTGAKTDPVVSLSPLSSTAKLTLRRVKIDGNQGVGIVAVGGTLTISQSTLSANAGGAISINGAQFDITNNLITGNGVATGGGATSLGGILLTQADAGTRRIEFNTITGNNAAMSLAAGVTCTIAQTATFSNNIVWDNTSGAAKLQFTGNCLWTYSDVGDPGTATPVAGMGNISVDPSFVVAGSNYHLKADSPAKNTADPAATITVDIDGDTRPQDGRCDMGADEFKLP